MEECCSLVLKKENFAVCRVKKANACITEKMLSIQLKALEADGLIKREVHGKKPPVRVEYSLTEFGKTLSPALDAIAKWGKNLGMCEGKLLVLNDKKKIIETFS